MNNSSEQGNKGVVFSGGSVNVRDIVVGDNASIHSSNQNLTESNMNLHDEITKLIALMKNEEITQDKIDAAELAIKELEKEFGVQKSKVILHARITAAKYSDPIIQHSLLNTMENMSFLAEALAFEINFYQMMFGASQKLEPFEEYEISTNKHGNSISPYNTVDYNMNEKKFTDFFMKILFEYNNYKCEAKNSSYEDIYFNILTSPHGEVYTDILNSYKKGKTNNEAKFINLLKNVNLSK
mgnify:CR=1 FL=1